MSDDPTVPEGRYVLRIPFTGFYESDHSGLLDDAIEGLLQDDDGEVDSELAAQFYEHYGYTSQLLVLYSKLYLAGLLQHIEDETGVRLDMTFHALDSPREYNFTTDSLFATTDARTLCLLALQVDLKTLGQELLDQYTSYDGFASFYSNQLEDWPACPLDWDHNQLGTLLQAWLVDRCGIPLAHEILEDERCNGQIDSLVMEQLPPPCHTILAALDKQREAQAH